SVILGVPVAAWGLIGFAIGAMLALPGAIAGATAGLADLLLLGVVSASLGLAVVMGVIMLGELHHVCLLCLSMDAVVLAWFIPGLPLAARFEPTGASWRGRKAAWAIVLAGGVVAVAGGTLAAVRTPGGVTTVQEIQTRDPKFYAWYTSLPVRP